MERVREADQRHIARVERLDRKIQPVVLRHLDVGGGGECVEPEDRYLHLVQLVHHEWMHGPNRQRAAKAKRRVVTVLEIAIDVRSDGLIPVETARAEADSQRSVRRGQPRSAINRLSADEDGFVVSVS